MFPFLKKKAPPPKLPADKIDSDAIRVIKNLNKAKFEAYVVGGGVRDLLLGLQPKDFDIATDARPRQISRALGRNAVVIGKRFKIVLFTIPEKEKQIEIATFRKAPAHTENAAAAAAKSGETPAKTGTLYQTEDNEWGTIEDDAFRRDFTANALYYDYSRDQIVDFVGGLSDISRKTLRCIGDPNIRFREDPVRMIRAVRLAAKLDFTIEKTSARAIAACAPEINLASKPRLFDELLKIFAANCSETAFRLAWSTGLLKHLLPGVAAFISDSGGKGSVFWDFLAALDTYRKSNPDDKVLASSNASSLIPFATILAPLYLSKHSKSQKRQRLAHDLVAQNLIAQFSNKLFSQPQKIFNNIAIYLATLPEYRINETHTSRNDRRERKERLAIGRIFWEICATALGDSKTLMFIKSQTYEAASEEESLPWELTGNADTGSAGILPASHPDSDVSRQDACAPGDPDDEFEDLHLELKQPKGDPPLKRFIDIFAEPRLEPAFRKLQETEDFENLLPEIHDHLKGDTTNFFALLAALDARRADMNLDKKNWRLVLPIAVLSIPLFTAAAERFKTGTTAPTDAPPGNAGGSPAPIPSDQQSAISDQQSAISCGFPPGALESISNTAVSSIFASLTREKHTYSTIRKRAAQALQTLYLQQIPQFWMSDMDIFRAIRAICAETIPGYIPPPDSTRPHSRRRRKG